MSCDMHGLIVGESSPSELKVEARSFQLFLKKNWWKNMNLLDKLVRLSSIRGIPDATDRHDEVRGIRDIYELSRLILVAQAQSSNEQ